jgi:hypothetical protein
VFLPTTLASDLAKYLYGKVDAVLRLRRNDDGTIESGVLESFTPLDDETVEAWRNWFRATGSEWDDIDNIERELGRI